MAKNVAKNDMAETTPPDRLESIAAQIACIVPCTESEGPGKRFAVWFQGCPLRCPGCCNPQLLSFEGGQKQPILSVIELLEETLRRQKLEGVTLLGGEPTAQPVAAAALARYAWQRGLTVLLFSGFTLEQLRQSRDPYVAELLAYTDMLVDGPYDRTLPETRRRWIGSSNQRLHFLSQRCSWDDRWLQKNTLEIRIRKSEIILNGYPSVEIMRFVRDHIRVAGTPASDDPN